MSNRNLSRFFRLALTLSAAVLVSASAWGQTFKVLHSFGGPGDGVDPTAGQTMDSLGNLYGVTEQGPAGQQCFSFGCGIVYRLKPNGDGTWTETVIHAFNGTDGAFPSSTPIADSHGNLYGSTYCDQDYCYHLGFVYELTPGSGGTWTETVLHQFSAPWEGGEPQDLIFDAAGNIYGDAYSGGPDNSGSVFSLSRSANWQERVLHNFGSMQSGDGVGPTGASAMDADGNFYGSTQAGGAYGAGVVFKLTKEASLLWQETLLYQFNGTTDGNFTNGVVFGPDGSLYGTTRSGGYLGAGYCGFARGCGTVFKLTPNADGTWTPTILYAFRGAGDGASPLRGVVFDRSGNLYGTTVAGGNNSCFVYGCGTVYELTQGPGGQWTKRTLHFFSGGSDGWAPFSTPMIDAAGNVYGTAEFGGLYNGGVAFEITP